MLPRIRSIIQPDSYLSGPVSWYYFEIPDKSLSIQSKQSLPGKAFSFFGDRHYSTGKDCSSQHSMKCARLLEDGSVVNESNQCEDISYYLSRVFEQCNEDQIDTHFFIEIAQELSYDHEKNGVYEDNLSSLKEIRNSGFASQPDGIRRIDEIYERDGNIGSLFYVFHDCFHSHDVLTREACRYSPHASFSFTDFRSDKYGEILMPNTYIFLSLIRQVQIKIRHILTGNNPGHREKDIKYLRKHIRLIDELIHIFVPRTKELYELLLFSENYRQDLQQFLDDAFSDVSDEVYQSKAFSHFQDNIQRLFEYEVKGKHALNQSLTDLAQEQIYYQGEPIVDLIEDFLQSRYTAFDMDSVVKAWDYLYDHVFDDFSNSSIEPQMLTDTLREKWHKYGMSKEMFTLEDLVYADSFILDGYLLAKAFSKDSGSLIISYVGYLHVEAYQDFFHDYLGLDAIQAVPYDDRRGRCIELKR